MVKTLSTLIQIFMVSCVLLPGLALASPTEAYRLCPQEVDDQRRLACFDRYAAAETAGDVPGRGSGFLAPSVVPTPRFGSGIDGLSNHEPNKMLGRMDENDISRLYMDATLSVKHPILNPVVDVVSSVFDIDQKRNLPRLYIAFTTRFSQYIGSRNSSPVIARRYNPELFLRVWRDEGPDRPDPSYWDFGYGHESNGQQVNSEDLYREIETFYQESGEPTQFARDSISRGWDYLSLDWNKQWSTGFLPNLEGQTETAIEYRHYLDDGLFQGAPEEYNLWEGVANGEKSRDYFDGLRFSVKYDFLDGPCPDFFCFEKVQVTHRTGYAKPFTRNTTSLELTASIAGLPINLWTQAGYNSDLVDYFDYTNSWGIGFEFFRNWSE